MGPMSPERLATRNIDLLPSLVSDNYNCAHLRTIKSVLPTLYPERHSREKRYKALSHVWQGLHAQLLYTLAYNIMAIKVKIPHVLYIQCHIRLTTKFTIIDAA